MSDLVFKSASQLAKLIQEREISSTELVEVQLEQISRHNSDLNAVVTIDADKAKDEAADADRALSQGDYRGPLHGIPVTVKDLLVTKDLRTTFGEKTYLKFVPQYDATAVARLRSAGAIIIGKTNVSQGFDIQTSNKIFGRTNNPWNLSYTPGGTSGGSAAAIASGLSPLDLCNDIGGSIRIPSHFCGVFGFKPTENRVPSSPPRRIKSIRHLITTGGISRSIEDLEILLSVIEGPDSRDWYVPPTLQQPVEDTPITQYRFAWSYDFGIPVTSDVKTTIDQIAAALSSQGCHVENAQFSKSTFNKAMQAFGEIAASELIVGQNIYSRSISSLSRLIPKSILSKTPVAQGFIKGSSHSMHSYMLALTQKDLITKIVEEFFTEYDVLFCPVTPGPAFKHIQTKNPLGKPIDVDGTKIPYWNWGMSYTSLFSLTGHPVVVVPATSTDEGLPIGIQLVGKRWQDKKLLSIAKKFTSITGQFKIPEGYQH